MARKKNKELNGVEISGGNRSSDQDHYETKRHLETIMDAEDIKADPKKMKGVSKLVKKHKKHFRSIADVKKHAQNMFGGPRGGPKADEDME